MFFGVFSKKKVTASNFFLDRPFPCENFGFGRPQLPAVGRPPEARVTGLYGCSYDLVIYVVNDVETEKAPVFHLRCRKNAAHAWRATAPICFAAELACIET